MSLWLMASNRNLRTEEFNLQETIALLERTPAVLNALLRGLPEAWTLSNEGQDTWSPLEIVGHLIHGEQTDWIPRTRVILGKDESRTFVPFERGGHAKLIAGRSLNSLLDEFAKIRAESLAALKAMNLQPADFNRRARHPAFGPVTLSQLLSTWVAHDLTHLHQISRCMAQQCREAVGPWETYLGVLHCNGHSGS